MLVTRLRAGAAGLLLITVLAACSGGATPSGVATLQSPGAGETDPSASPSASLDPETARLEFARCMREHGIDLPDPGSGGASGPITIGGNGPDVEKMQDAMEVCQQIPGRRHGSTGGDRSRDAGQDARVRQMHARERGRLRGSGLQRRRRGRIQIGGPGGIDPSSDEFQAAQEACQSILGDLGPRFNGGPGSDGPGGGDGPTTIDGDSGVEVAP